jgi:uncharacterized protein (UPF0371 family)
MQETGFNTDRYIKFQLRKIESTVKNPGSKLYIEFGGKIIQDKHSARVLPGYREDAKLDILKAICKDEGEAIFVVSARDINRGRIRGDYKITYDDETLRTIDGLKSRGLKIKHVVFSLLNKGEEISEAIINLEKKLNTKGIKTYHFHALDGYNSIDFDINEFLKNPFIETSKRIICIVSPGGGSGKFGICLNQLFYEMKKGISPKYLKFETFPVHDLPLNHPINLAFMAASADFYDIVMRDERHGKATSYNRDLENYESLNLLSNYFKSEARFLRKLTSATNMGINMLSKGIINEEVIQKEAAAEVARRLVRYKFEVEAGKEHPSILDRVRKIMSML